MTAVWREEYKTFRSHRSLGQFTPAHIESFHDKLRDEFLNRELIGTLLEAKILVEGHRQ